MHNWVFANTALTCHARCRSHLSLQLGAAPLPHSGLEGAVAVGDSTAGGRSLLLGLGWLRNLVVKLPGHWTWVARIWLGLRDSNGWVKWERERESDRERDREIERKTYTNNCIYIYMCVCINVCGSYIYFMLIFMREFQHLHQAMFVSRRVVQKWGINQHAETLAETAGNHHIRVEPPSKYGIDTH